MQIHTNPLFYLVKGSIFLIAALGAANLMVQNGNPFGSYATLVKDEVVERGTMFP